MSLILKLILMPINHILKELAFPLFLAYKIALNTSTKTPAWES